MILKLDARRARKLADQLGERLASFVPFGNVGDFLRVVVGLEPLRDEAAAHTGRPRSKTPSKAALYARAARGDEEAQRQLAALRRKPRRDINAKADH
ncbi:MAG: hypothetical protein MOB07_31160 [Acidobacteria bacterium]|nr:hypothetical protein [Acidobacteriota bacterium]